MNYFQVLTDSINEYQNALAYYKSPNTPTLGLHLAGSTAKLLADWKVAGLTAQALAQDFVVVVEAVGGGLTAAPDALAQLQGLATSKRLNVPPIAWDLLEGALGQLLSAVAAKTAGK